MGKREKELFLCFLCFLCFFVFMFLCFSVFLCVFHFSVTYPRSLVRRHPKEAAERSSAGRRAECGRQRCSQRICAEDALCQ